MNLTEPVWPHSLTYGKALPLYFSAFMLSTIIIVRILTCIQGDFRSRHYFAAAARKISINGGGGEVGGGGGGEGNWELYPGLESFHRGRCYWLWWKTVPFADGAGEEGLLPVRGLQAGSRYVA